MSGWSGRLVVAPLATTPASIVGIPAHKGQRLDNGKQSQYIPLDQVEAVQATIARGKRYMKLRRDLCKVEAEITAIDEQARKLGIRVKNPLGDRDATVEWYTPPWVIEYVRQVFPQIDLDAASNAVAQTWIQARHFYTEQDDGLLQPWFGYVRCNPPYGSPSTRLMAKEFFERAISHHAAGETMGILLLLNRTGADWYRHLLGQATAVCEVHKRIAFHDQAGQRQRSPRYYNDIVCLGQEVQRFQEVFSAIGTVRVINPPASLA